MLPAQQACPDPPQVAQRLVRSQAKPTLQVLPAQHACPDAPHDAQVPALHTLPALQALPAQQAAPTVPHARHIPAAHTSVVVLQRLDAQQA